MNQFKNVFLGLEKRSYKRAATVQKCMRVSGKHNDLETVGRTAKHHTFFEMLGNFSFGDYFKREAIAFAWELVTGVFGLPKDRLYATVYLDDDEAFRLWADEVGVPADADLPLREKGQFLGHGRHRPVRSLLGDPLRPRRGHRGGRALAASSRRGATASSSSGTSSSWSSTRDGQGVLRPLPSPSIDTGMGLERMAAVLQGKRSNFDTDLFMPLIEAICETGRAGISGRATRATSRSGSSPTTSGP